MMLSRVAENLYWVGRYLERAENTARLINSTTQVLLDLPVNASFGWDVLIKVAGLDAEFGKRYPHADEDSIIRFLIEDEDNPSSIISSIHNARENTRTVREVLPMELWERINSLYLYIRENAARTLIGRGPRDEVLRAVIGQRESIVGLLTGSMSRDVAYQFIKLGRNMERADMTTRIVDVNSAVHLPADSALAALTSERAWISTLNALSAYQMYRNHVGVHVRSHDVVEFLLKDPHFPRTVKHCLAEIEGCLSTLPQHVDAMKQVRKAWRRLDGMKLEGLTSPVLHEYLDQVQADIGAIHAAVARQYFHLHQRTNGSGENQ
jgi:uncharacterized alpha-E superfamily protein